MIKQILIVRKDLHMRSGKIAAQCSHASMKVFLDRMTKLPFSGKDLYETSFTPEMEEWINWEEGKPGFTKIVVSCNSEQELFDLKQQADEANIPNALILDNGVTEFHGVKTYTVLAIGPDTSERIDLTTGKLSLM